MCINVICIHFLHFFYRFAFLQYVFAHPAEETPKSSEVSPDHEHSENCGHPLDKIKEGLTKIKNKISQTVTNAKNAVVEKYKNIKASFDKNKNGTTVTTESYGRRNEPALPREPFPPVLLPEGPREPTDDPEFLRPNGQPETGFSSGIVPGPELTQGSITSEVSSVNIDEVAINQDPSLIDQPQNTDSQNPPIDLRFGKPAGRQYRQN